MTETPSNQVEEVKATRLPRVLATPASDQENIDLRKLTSKQLEQKRVARKQVERLRKEQGPIDTG